MAEDFRVLVTGSRDYGRRDIIRSALGQAEREHQESRLILVHGMCDPRHPVSGHAIRWAAAMRMPMPLAGNLLGADWLAFLIVTCLGWETEPHPADWHRHGKSGGFRRNEHMVKLGANLCLAFAAPCTAPRCTGRPAHPSHGTEHCAGLAEKAGIETRRFRDGW